MEEFKKGDVVELVGNAKIVRLKSDINDSGHYLATLDPYDQQPNETADGQPIIGKIVYLHHGEIFKKVADGE